MKLLYKWRGQGARIRRRRHHLGCHSACRFGPCPGYPVGLHHHRFGDDVIVAEGPQGVWAQSFHTPDCYHCCSMPHLPSALRWRPVLIGHAILSF